MTLRNRRFSNQALFVILIAVLGIAGSARGAEPDECVGLFPVPKRECELAGAFFPQWAADDWRLFCRDHCPRPKTLFAWPGAEMTFVDGTEKAPLQSDRPDFTEASSNVGLRRLQIEMGYTYTLDNNNGTRSGNHSFPETLYRYGMFAEWFEARIAWNYNSSSLQQGSVSTVFQGSDDLYLGAKFALTEQKGWLPEMVLLPQMTVPTGHPAFSAGEVQPGINWLYGWDITEFISCGASTQVNRARDDSGVFYAEFAQSLTIGYTFTEKLGGYTEWFALIPAGAAVALPQQYFDGGFTFKVHNNLQFDIRAGMGLNDAADDFFAGAGSVVRF